MFLPPNSEKKGNRSPDLLVFDLDNRETPKLTEN